MIKFANIYGLSNEYIAGILYYIYLPHCCMWQQC